MNRYYKTVLFLILVLFPLSSYSENYYSKISSLIPQEAIDNEKLGVYVRSLTTGETIFKYNENKSFIPASNNKIITSYAALTLLGKDFRFKTEFYSGGEIADGVMFGGLYVKGYGDPTISSETLKEIVEEFKGKGINEIKGDVFLDDTYFDSLKYAKGWKKEWIGNYYCPPITTFTLNYNTIDVRVFPTTVGKHPNIRVEPNGSYINFVNKAYTSTKRGGVYASLDNLKNTAYVRGRIHPKRGDKVITFSVSDPLKYFGSILSYLLEKEGIEFNGDIKRTRVPSWAKLFYTHESEPLYMIINEYNKESVNIIGETLVKTMGAEFMSKPGSWENGSKVISELLKKNGVTGYIEIADGSGLSNFNRVTPEALGIILAKAYKDEDFSYEFVSSLPVAGVDGTLKKRFRGSKIKGRVIAKTGYLKGVRTLSGYVYTSDGNVIVFSILSNGLGWKAKAFQNDLLNLLVDCCKV